MRENKSKMRFVDNHLYIKGYTHVKQANEDGVEKHNFKDISGDYLLPKWADRVFLDLRERHPIVAFEVGEKWNYLTDEGELIDNEWFDTFENYYGGLYKVTKNGLINFINVYRDRFVSDTWFTNAVLLKDTPFTMLKCQHDHLWMMNAIGQIMRSGSLLH